MSPGGSSLEDDAPLGRLPRAAVTRGGHEERSRGAVTRGGHEGSSADGDVYRVLLIRDVVVQSARRDHLQEGHRLQACSICGS